MPLDKYTILREQYGRFLAEGPLYGAFSHARGFRDTARGQQVLDKLIYDNIQSGNTSLAGRISFLRTNVGIERIFELIDSPKKFMYLEERGELPPESSNVKVKSLVSRASLSERVYTGIGAGVAALIAGIFVWELFVNPYFFS